MINQFIHWLYLVWGIKKMSIAFVCGVLAAFALPPYGLFPVLFIAFPVLLWLIEGASSAGTRINQIKHAFWVGWFFGFGFFLNSLWWIGAAFLVDAEKFAHFLPFAVTALPASLAFFFAFSAALTRYFWGNGQLKIISFTFSFLLFEFIRGFIFTGFPWNLFGYALTQNLITAQFASVIGVYGLSALVFYIFSLPALWFETEKIDKNGFIWLFIVVFICSFGFYRLSSHQTSFVDGVSLRIVQASIPQDAKFNSRNKETIVDKYLKLSDEATSSARTGLNDVTHLIWTESAFPFFLQNDQEMLLKISKALSPKTVLITGGVRVGEQLPNTSRPPVYNSLFALNNQAQFIASYDKNHLVPFGEYLPFQTLLESIGLRQLTQVIGGFSSGVKRDAIDLPNTPSFSPLICYEGIFPNAVQAGNKRAEWILNVTNDAWFGLTPGPYQHFEMTKVRAIEEGVPLVRAANNGISAIIDPLGRVVKKLDLGETGVLDGALPYAVSKPFVAKFGRSIPLILIGVLFLIVIFMRRNARSHNS